MPWGGEVERRVDLGEKFQRIVGDLDARPEAGELADVDTDPASRALGPAGDDTALGRMHRAESSRPMRPAAPITAILSFPSFRLPVLEHARADSPSPARRALGV